jgi:hypothetical protein
MMAVPTLTALDAALNDAAPYPHNIKLCAQEILLMNGEAAERYAPYRP